MIIDGLHGSLRLERIKPAAVAGLFYPDEPDRLRLTVDALLAGARSGGAGRAKAIVAPHAGYRYSGEVAASAYARLAARAGEIRRVVLIGPSHHVAFHGVAVPGSDVFETPIGRIPVDRDGVERALALPFVQTLDGAFEREHSLEVHLPFLIEALGEFQLVPLVAGRAGPDEVSALLEVLWGGAETAIVVSTDLSHFHDYDTARRLDEGTDAIIRALRVEDLEPGRACGSVGLAGLLHLARRRGLEVSTLDLRNSGDTAGGRDRVVGYGSWMVVEPPKTGLDLQARRTALGLAANAVAAAARGERATAPDPGALPAVLRAPGAAFVTLEKDGVLRGCIGSLEATRPLAEDILHNARAAALADPRFTPVRPDEVDALDISISVLGPAQPMRFASEADLLAQLRPGVDGLVLRDGDHRGTFLPAVWEKIPAPREFLRALKRKAGLDQAHWSSTIEIARYETESFS